MPAKSYAGCCKRIIRLKILLLASLFFFMSCGIPTYLYIDENEISWASVETTSTTDPAYPALECSITLSANALSDISEMVETGPAIKFFYVLSTDSDESSLINGDVSVNGTSPSIASLFNTYLRKTTGDGDIWIVGTRTAPGFYIFEDADGDTTYSRILPDDDELNIDEPEGILVGTFAVRPAGSSDAHEFRGMYTMDLEWPSEKAVLDFSIVLQPGEESNQAVLAINSDTENLEAIDYAIHEFPLDATALETTLSVSSDTAFTDYLQNADPLYLHVWASFFGGEGSFNNIFWSKLEYLGSLRLWE